MADSMATDWYYLPSGAATGQQVGPLTWEQLWALRSSGSLQATDLVWHPSMSQWTPAAQVQGLFPAPVPNIPPAYQAGAYQPGAYQQAPYQQAPYQQAARRPSMLAWLLPLIALVIIGAGLGTYFGFFYDKDEAGSENLTAADLEGSWEGTFAYDSVHVDNLSDEEKDILDATVGTACPLTMDVTVDSDGQGVAEMVIDMSAADPSFGNDYQTLYFTYSDGKLSFDSEESGADVEAKVLEKGDELVWACSLDFSNEEASGSASFEAAKGWEPADDTPGTTED